MTSETEQKVKVLYAPTELGLQVIRKFQENPWNYIGFDGE